MLITRCQTSFEKFKSGFPSIETIAKKKAEIEAVRAAILAAGDGDAESESEAGEQLTSKQKSKQSAAELRSLQAELEELQVGAKKRALGTLKFIGELFKQKMLSEVIIFHCITNLLENLEDEESLECLVILLVTVGKDLDQNESNVRLTRLH